MAARLKEEYNSMISSLTHSLQCNLPAFIGIHFHSSPIIGATWDVEVLKIDIYKISEDGIEHIYDKEFGYVKNFSIIRLRNTPTSLHALNFFQRMQIITNGNLTPYVHTNRRVYPEITVTTVMPNFILH